VGCLGSSMAVMGQHGEAGWSGGREIGGAGAGRIGA
jgi:hypothetical protein